MRRALILLAFACAACHQKQPPYALIGDPHRGKAMIERYGCTSCHIIPGAAGQGLVGPSLNGIGARLYLAGHYPNVPQNMVRWIRFPAESKPMTAMPDLHVTDRDGRDIAAYLYTLR